MIPSQCINLDVHYYSHPKVKRLIGLLGKGAADLPIRLWCHCGEYRGDTGILTDYSPQEIEAVCEWWGKTGQMIEAFLKLKIIEQDGDCYIVHDWNEWQGHIGALRERGRSNAKKKWDSLKSDATSNADSNASSNARRDALSGAERRGTERIPPKSPDQFSVNSTDTPHARDLDGTPLIPKALDDPRFIAAWGRWNEYKNHRLPPLSAEAQLAECAEWGVARAVAAINYSIKSSYAKLCEPNGSVKPGRSKSAVGVREDV